MNDTKITSTQEKNCGGRCISEMQKCLDSQVITEYFQVAKDFYNDDKTAKELKNLIISETNECIELLKTKCTELMLMIDEVFLNRRNCQSSFYRMCHKLARFETTENLEVEDESRCICFSVENLKRFNVDLAVNSNVKLLTNISALKDEINQIYGELFCTKCSRLSRLNTHGCFNSKSEKICDCSLPSVTSQHKVHEAILDLCDSKDINVFKDSWYVTHLKRDAEYYRKRIVNSPLPSNDSVDSFEVISHAQSKLETNTMMNGMDLIFSSECDEENPEIVQLGNNIQKLSTAYDKNINDSFITWPDTSDTGSVASSVSNVEKILNKVSICNSVESDASKTSKSNPILLYNKNIGSVLETAKKTNYVSGNDSTQTAIKDSNKVAPAAIIRHSFCQYLNFEAKAKLPRMPFKIIHTSQNFEEVFKLTKTSSGKSINEHLNNGGVNDPCNLIKSAFYSYLGSTNQPINKWLRKSNEIKSTGI